MPNTLAVLTDTKRMATEPPVFVWASMLQSHRRDAPQRNTDYDDSVLKHPMLTNLKSCTISIT